jgi:hypothetical protein
LKKSARRNRATAMISDAAVDSVVIAPSEFEQSRLQGNALAMQRDVSMRLDE